MPTTKINKVNQYLKDYFESKIIEDLKIMLAQDEKRNSSHNPSELSFTLPYLLLVSAGIDFLGALELGFEIGSNRRSCHFITNWMSQTCNLLYTFPEMDSFLYDSVRCGITHQAIFKTAAESYKGYDHADKHLHVRSEDGKKRIFLHTKQYIEDFLASYESFKSNFIPQHIDDVYNRIFPQSVAQNTWTNLLESLERDGYIFFEKASPSPSPAPPKDE